MMDSVVSAPIVNWLLKRCTHACFRISLALPGDHERLRRHLVNFGVWFNGKRPRELAERETIAETRLFRHDLAGYRAVDPAFHGYTFTMITDFLAVPHRVGRALVAAPDGRWQR